MKNGSETATWLREWNLDGPRANTPHIGWISISICTGHGLYSTPGNDETLRIFKQRVYNTLHTIAAASRESREMRIKQLHPDTQWKNLHTAWVSEEIASKWYIVLHYMVPTNERLHVIKLVGSGRCRYCGR